MQEQRINEIQKYVWDHEFCTYEELCVYCNVSLSTIKRDVQQMAEAGLLTRIRGGARVPREKHPDVYRTTGIEPLKYQSNLNRIAQKASTLVADNDVVYLGSGVTVAHMVKHLRGHKDLTVITNSIYVMMEAFQYDIDIMVVGGMLNRNTMSYIGIQSINHLKELNANIAFISCNGVAISHGITNSSEMEGDVKKAAMQISDKTVLLADEKKFDKISLYSVAELDVISSLITDKPLDERYLREIRNSHTKLIIADD